MNNNGKILVELQEWMGSDTAIANAAWTSTYDKERREGKYDEPDKVAGIVRRLILDGHGVPVESVVLRFWIRMPIFTDRQLMTHRIQSPNGLSGRYRTMPNDWYTIPEDVMAIWTKVPVYHNTQFELRDEFDKLCGSAYKWYANKIDILKAAEKMGNITNAEFKRGREIFRAVLPTAGMVERTTIMNLRAFANYQKQRNSTNAQQEIQTVAKLMLSEVKTANIAPVAISTLEEKGWII